MLEKDLAPYRDELILSTKAGGDIGPSPYTKGGSRKSLLTSLEHSLRDLGTDYVDVFYHHRPDLDVPLEETAGALVSAVQQGKALYVGISNYRPDRAEAIAGLLREAGVPLLIHQPRYSIFDRSIEQNGLLELSAAQGFGLIVYSPLAQGLLTNKYLRSRSPRVPGRRTRASSPRTPSTTPTGSGPPSSTSSRSRAGSRSPSWRSSGCCAGPRSPRRWWARARPGKLDHNVAALDAAPLTDEELAIIDEHGVHGTGLEPVTPMA